MIIISTSNAKLYMFAGLKKDTRQVWTGTLGFLRCQNATMLYSGDNVTSIYSFLRKGGSYYIMHNINENVHLFFKAELIGKPKSSVSVLIHAFVCYMSCTQSGLFSFHNWLSNLPKILFHAFHFWETFKLHNRPHINHTNANICLL